MNVFQQVFAEVSPHANDLLAKEGHRSPPIRIKTNDLSATEMKKNKTVNSVRKEMHDNTMNKASFAKNGASSMKSVAVYDRPSSFKETKPKCIQPVDVKLNCENTSKRKFTAEEALIDQQINKQKEELAKVLEELNQVRSEVDKQFLESKTIEQHNIEIQNFIQNNKTKEEKIQAIVEEYAAKRQEIDEKWSTKISQVSKSV